jgi:phospholipid/cholesterol/gamma-HCH transport system substrate-binding protein
MKKNITNKISLGIFVTAGLLLFTLGIYFIGQRQQLFKETFQVNTIFKDVNGLQPGNNVRFSGINVGIVSNITQVTDTTVRVDMQIDERTRKFIKRNAKASIGSDGLMGNKIVIIAPGTSNESEVSNNSFIEATPPINIDDVLLKLKGIGDNASSITSDLAVVTKNIRIGKGTIGMLFTDTVFAHNLGAAMVNVKQGSQGFKQNMDAASKSFLLRGFLKKDKKKEEKKDGTKAQDKKQ